MKKKILFSIFIIFLLINNCGFKIVNNNEIYKFDINEIIATGDNRINFKIKNKLIFSSKKNEKKLIDIYLDTNKSKEVKEKNSNNEITKYQISIATTVRVKELVSEKEISFNVIKTGDYIVDMGPEGGVKGGKIIAEGKPEEICKIHTSYTGKFLKPLL